MGIENVWRILVSKFDDLIGDLKKKYKSNIFTGDDIQSTSEERLSTGSLALDVETGGGLPFGRIVEMFGTEGSGKTTMALKIVACAQKLEIPTVWVDLEGALDTEWAALLGVDLSKLIVMKPENGGQAADMIHIPVSSGGRGVIVFDSVAAIIDEKEKDKSIEDDSAKVGARATIMSRLIPAVQAQLNSHDAESGWNSWLPIFINQVRDKIGIVYGNPETTPGGRSLPFYASIRIRLSRGEYLEGEDSVGQKAKIGHMIKFKTVKNRTAAPLKEGQIPFYFEGPMKGCIDVAEELIRYGVLYKLVELSGRTYNFEDLKAVGKANFAKELREHPEIVEKLVIDIKKMARVYGSS